MTSTRIIDCIAVTPPQPSQSTPLHSSIVPLSNAMLLATSDACFRVAIDGFKGSRLRCNAASRNDVVCLDAFRASLLPLVSSLKRAFQALSSKLGGASHPLWERRHRADDIAPSDRRSDTKFRSLATDSARVPCDVAAPSRSPRFYIDSHPICAVCEL